MAGVGGYNCTSITGGAAGSLDGIDGLEIDEGAVAVCHTVEEGMPFTSWYRAELAHGGTPNPPYIVPPVTNPGNIRWLLENAAKGFINRWLQTQIAKVQTLTFATNVSWSVLLGNDAKLIMTGNCTLDNPSDAEVGVEGYLTIEMDSTGGWELALGSNFYPLSNVPINLKKDPSAINSLTYKCHATDIIELSYGGFIIPTGP